MNSHNGLVAAIRSVAAYLLEGSQDVVVDGPKPPPVSLIDAAVPFSHCRHSRQAQHLELVEHYE